MNRFSDDGYKFVARRDPDKFSREKPDAKKIYSQRPLDDEIKKTPPAGPAQEDKEDEESTLRFVQMTMEGSEYVKQIKKSELREQSARYEKGDSTTKASPPVATLPDGTNNRKTRGLGQKNDRRQLNTIGTDDRSYVTDTTVFPYSAVAQVDFDIFFGAGGCTATMISRNVALTAGHCVFVEGNWKYVPWIAPGRNLATSGFVVEPYGLWAADTLITLTEWTTQETIEHDMAVITLVPIQADPGNECADLYPGDVTGYIGFDRAERGDQRLPTATITGYPGDKPYGSMWDTGICQAPPGEPSNWVPFPDKTHFSLHFCDTAGGMSGSAVLANENIALGDHAYGFSDQNNVPIANGATMMETDYFDAILDWSGRLKDLPSCSQCRSSSSGLFFGRCK